MTVFNIIAMLGGLALFLYGMRVMGDGLKQGSSSALKNAMGMVTNNPFMGFVLGLGVTGPGFSSSSLQLWHLLLPLSAYFFLCFAIRASLSL